MAVQKEREEDGETTDRAKTTCEMEKGQQDSVVKREQARGGGDSRRKWDDENDLCRDEGYAEESKHAMNGDHNVKEEGEEEMNVDARGGMKREVRCEAAMKENKDKTTAVGDGVKKGDGAESDVRTEVDKKEEKDRNIKEENKDMDEGDDGGGDKSGDKRGTD